MRGRGRVRSFWKGEKKESTSAHAKEREKMIPSGAQKRNSRQKLQGKKRGGLANSTFMRKEGEVSRQFKQLSGEKIKKVIKEGSGAEETAC